MGIGRRLFDGARANLHSLVERVLRDELQAATEDQPDAELQRRQRARSEQESERQRRLAMEAAARSRGSARRKQERKAPRPNRTGEARARQLHLQQLYAVLGVRSGAPFDELKKAYRALMREHHPDRHGGDPEAERRAGERAARISAAYAELETLVRPRG